MILEAKGIFKGLALFVASIGIQTTLAENASIMKDIFAGIAQFTVGLYTVIQIIKTLRKDKNK